MRALQDLVSAMQAGQWADAADLYSAAKGVWEELRRNHDLRLTPPSLRRLGCPRATARASPSPVAPQAPGGAPRVPALLHHGMGVHSHPVQRGGGHAEAAPLRGLSSLPLVPDARPLRVDVDAAASPAPTGSRGGAAFPTVAERLLPGQPGAVVGQTGAEPPPAPEEARAGEAQIPEAPVILPGAPLDAPPTHPRPGRDCFFPLPGDRRHQRRAVGPFGANRTQARASPASRAHEGVGRLQEVSHAAAGASRPGGRRRQTREFGLRPLLGEGEQLLVEGALCR